MVHAGVSVSPYFLPYFARCFCLSILPAIFCLSGVALHLSLALEAAEVDTHTRGVGEGRNHGERLTLIVLSQGISQSCVPRQPGLYRPLRCQREIGYRGMRDVAIHLDALRTNGHRTKTVLELSIWNLEFGVWNFIALFNSTALSFFSRGLPM